jgi:hypothetical protein
VKRHGPRIRVVYDCTGCAFLERRPGHDRTPWIGPVGLPILLCAEPTVSERYGEPQALGYDGTPTWCPCRGAGA